MPIKVYDNAQLEESEITCPVQDVFRNSGHLFELNTSSENKYASRTPDISGTSTLMISNHAHVDSCFLGPVVKSENCIYMMSKPTEDDVTKNVYACEYNIDTNTLTSILAFTGNSRYTTKFYITYLEDRKIIVVEEDHDVDSDDYARFYLVDFEANTSTLEYEYQTHWNTGEPLSKTVDITAIKSLKKDNGDIWIYLVGWHYLYTEGFASFVGGVSVFFKNFTQDGEWGNVYVDVPPIEGRSIEAIMYQDPVFINKDYLVVIASVSSTGPGSYAGFVFNLDTNTITVSPLYTSPDGWWEPLCYFSAPDNESGVLYFQAYECFDAGTAVMKFDPVTLDTSVVYTSDDYDLDYDIFMLSSRDNAYFFDGANNNIYRANDLTLVGNFTSVIPDGDPWNWLWGMISYTLDDSLGFWWWNAENQLLKHISSAGVEIDSYSLPAIANNWFYGGVFLLGEDIVIESADVSYWDSISNYYLIR